MSWRQTENDLLAALFSRVSVDCSSSLSRFVTKNQTLSDLFRQSLFIHFNLSQWCEYGISAVKFSFFRSPPFFPNPFRSKLLLLFYKNQPEFHNRAFHGVRFYIYLLPKSVLSHFNFILHDFRFLVDSLPKSKQRNTYLRTFLSILNAAFLPSFWNGTIIRILVETKRPFRTIALAISASHLVSPTSSGISLALSPCSNRCEAMAKTNEPPWVRDCIGGHCNKKRVCEISRIQGAVIAFSIFLVSLSFRTAFCMLSSRGSFVMWWVLVLCLWGQSKDWMNPPL